LRHLRELNPKFLLVLDELSFAQQVKGVLPQCNVIYRDRSLHPQGDEAYAQVFSPQQFVDKVTHFADGGLILHTTNEPEFSEKTVVWNTQVMELLAKKNLPAVVDGWAAGQPGDVNAWKQPFMQRHLELLNARRDLFLLNLHEYAGGVITSGFVGGHPQETQYHPDYVQVTNWPSIQQAKSLTMWHCGRFRFLQYALESWKINWPRIVLTEHGFDMMRDIGGWLGRISRDTVKYPEASGWKSLSGQWENWWRTLGWGAEQAYFEQVAFADKVIYNGSAVEAQLLYCMGSNSPRWEAFNVQNAFNLQERLVQYANAAVVAPPPAPPAPPVVVAPPITVVAPPAVSPPLSMTEALHAIAEQLRKLASTIEDLKLP
jgi:hypothetical protein